MLSSPAIGFLSLPRWASTRSSAAFVSGNSALRRGVEHVAHGVILGRHRRLVVDDRLADARPHRLAHVGAASRTLTESGGDIADLLAGGLDRTADPLGNARPDQRQTFCDSCRRSHDRIGRHQPARQARPGALGGLRRLYVERRLGGLGGGLWQRPAHQNTPAHHFHGIGHLGEIGRAIDPLR